MTGLKSRDAFLSLGLDIRQVGVKAQPVHMLTVGPQAEHVSEPLFIHLYLNSITYFMGVVIIKAMNI